MTEEKSIKNLLTIVLVLIIVGLVFVIYDIEKNEGAIVDGVADVVTLTDSEDELEKDEIDSQNTEPVVAPIEVKKTVPVVTKSEPSTLGPGITVVTYGDSGFIPPVVEVTAGDSITFINSSSKPMWVTSADHPTAKAQVYRGFDQGKSVPSGGSYNFSFLKVGVWGYKNLNVESHLGAVSVVPQ